MNYNKFLNLVKIKPIPVHDEKTKPPRHWMYFDVLYPNIAIISKRRSGKTTVIYNIIKKALQPKETTVIVFCPNHLKDNGWKSIKDYVKSKGNELLLFTSIVDEHKQNQLESIIKELEEETDDVEDEESEEEDEEKLEVERPMRGGFKFEEEKEEEEKEKKQRKKSFKYDFPRYIIIFDDISNELHNPYLNKLLKNARHHKAMVICSSQYDCDLKPEAWKQIDYALLFKSLDKIKLNKIYTALDLNLGENGQNKFYELYKHATKDKYNFLYIDRNGDDYRKNFYPRYNLKKFFKENVEDLDEDLDEDIEDLD